RSPGKGKRMSRRQSAGGGKAARIALHAHVSPATAQDEAAQHVKVRGLAGGLEFLLAEVDRLREAVRQREAELATHIPVVSHASTDDLAERLEAALVSAAEVVGADAAGLYVLDEATSSLKLRAAHNLPESRLLDRPRRLEGALADLEALSGNAVVLEDTNLL